MDHHWHLLTLPTTVIASKGMAGGSNQKARFQSLMQTGPLYTDSGPWLHNLGVGRSRTNVPWNIWHLTFKTVWQSPLLSLLFGISVEWRLETRVISLGMLSFFAFSLFNIPNNPTLKHLNYWWLLSYVGRGARKQNSPNLLRVHRFGPNRLPNPLVVSTERYCKYTSYMETFYIAVTI